MKELLNPIRWTWPRDAIKVDNERRYNLEDDEANPLWVFVFVGLGCTVAASYLAMYLASSWLVAAIAALTTYYAFGWLLPHLGEGLQE